jgi:hypothetical protein
MSSLPPHLVGVVRGSGAQEECDGTACPKQGRAKRKKAMSLAHFISTILMQTRRIALGGATLRAVISWLSFYRSVQE